MSLIPEAFATEIATRGGEFGRTWVAGLPQLIEALCHEWQLDITGTPNFGYWAVVFPVEAGSMPAVLRISFPDTKYPLQTVTAALSLWQGHGAVQLLRSDVARHALLLERLDTQTTLETIPIGEALQVAGALLRRLSIPAPLGTSPHLRTIIEQTARTLETRWEQLGRPVPKHVIEQTQHLIAELLPTIGDLLVNWDLHYGNILAATREPWLAIDPSLVVGDPEYALAQLLWWRLEDIEAAGGIVWALNRLVVAGGFDFARASSWSYVRTVDYWLMGLEIGLTIDPVRCQRVVEALDTLR